HDALRELGVEVCALLSRELEAGADLPFEVIEEAGVSDEGPVLYRYSPLTADFLGERWPAVRELEVHGRAVAALGPAATAYLRHRGLPGSLPDDALRDVMERVLEDATSFDFPEERFQRVHAELDATLEETTVTVTVVAPLHGVRIAEGRVDLGGGLALTRRAVADPPSEALEGTAAEVPADDLGGPPSAPSPLDVFCELRRELPADAPLPVGDARTLFRRLLTGLRLCGAGGTALGPLAWARAGGGAWHPIALGVSARARPESWELRYGEEDELVELLRVLARSRHGDAVGWALGRFEMGCERERETEALSDYLLALRALLADAGSGGEVAMGRRLAALCAPPEDRSGLRSRVALALSVERGSMYDARPLESGLSLDSPRALVREIEEGLRALLRDVLCGYLDEDLRSAADAILRREQGPRSVIEAEPVGAEPVAASEMGASRVPADPGIRPPEEEDTRELEPVRVGALS
ncbi:MAG TPA: hypothetical protein VGR10_04780, partial [Thermoleophilaceae bacterium]|nr:hypothetical protein [Thermoleophilaceae bacterium]